MSKPSKLAQKLAARIHARHGEPYICDITRTAWIIDVALAKRDDRLAEWLSINLAMYNCNVSFWQTHLAEFCEQENKQ